MLRDSRFNRASFAFHKSQDTIRFPLEPLHPPILPIVKILPFQSALFILQSRKHTVAVARRKAHLGSQAVVLLVDVYLPSVLTQA